MNDRDCVAFLQWAAPRLGLRWRGLRRVRRQVRKRLARRLAALGLDDLDAYRVYLDQCPDEWSRVDQACRITISRFYRDRAVWEGLGREVLPALAQAVARRGESQVRVWSAGCASGEEPYTVKLVWERVAGPRFPDLDLRVVATDADESLLARARRGCYPETALRDLPPTWKDEAFEPRGREFCLRPPWRGGIELRHQDLRTAMPAGPFDLVLCRNLAFTYFAPRRQLEVLDGILGRLAVGGALVIGGHETLPAERRAAIGPWPGAPCVLGLPPTPPGGTKRARIW